MRPSGASQRPTCRSRSARRSSRRSCRRPTTCRRLSVSSSATSVQVEMPQMGISVSEGTILEWRKAVGDQVAADEPIADVTTDKVDVEIPCPAAGVLAKILVEPGQTVPVGEVIAEVDVGGGSSAPASQDADTPATEEQSEAGDGESDRSAFVSPVVRRMAEEHGVDLAQVEGHG